MVMNRRTFTGALAGFAAAAAPARPAESDRRTRFYALETFELKNGTQAGRMHDWLGNSLLPKLQKIHLGSLFVKRYSSNSNSRGVRSVS